MDGDFELETEPASADDDGDAPPDTAPKLSPPRDRGEETWRTSPEAIQVKFVGCCLHPMSQEVACGLRCTSSLLLLASERTPG